MKKLLTALIVVGKVVGGVNAMDAETAELTRIVDRAEGKVVLFLSKGALKELTNRLRAAGTEEVWVNPYTAAAFASRVSPGASPVRSVSSSTVSSPAPSVDSEGSK